MNAILVLNFASKFLWATNGLTNDQLILLKRHNQAVPGPVMRGTC